MKISWRTESPQLLVITLMFIAAGVMWGRVPEQMPVHWNLAGEVDRFGGRFEGLLMLPIITLGMYLLMLLVPRIDPGKANYPHFWRVYTILRFALTAFLAVIFAASLVATFSDDQSLSRIVPLSIGALFVVLGNYMGKLRPNWFVGIRTPWTLSSKLSWTKTHRLGGWLFVLMGVGIFAFGITAQQWVFHAVLGFSFVALIILLIYSYMIYRQDPNRTAPAGTSPASD